MKGDRSVTGTLHAYDQHLNMVLSDARETRQLRVEDEQTEVGADRSSTAAVSHPRTRQYEMLFLRGDSIILVAPQS